MREPTTHRFALFDVEGTLVNCAPQTLACWHETLREFGHQISVERLQPYSGLDGRDMLKQLLPGSPEREMSDMLERQGELYRDKYLSTVRAFPRVRDLFVRLKQDGYRAGLATGCQPDELKVYLSLTGIGDLVEATACGGDAKKGKPHPRLIELVLGRLGVVGGPSIVMVGDTPYDAEAARKLGLTAWGTLGGGYTAADLRAAGCTAVFQGPEEMLQRFDEVFGVAAEAGRMN
jgi:HAD superfamily hydrolase (TIGR01549 family)